jgi:hypothetical protein
MSNTGQDAQSVSVNEGCESWDVKLSWSDPHGAILDEKCSEIRAFV